MRESLAFSLPLGGPNVALLWLAVPAMAVLQFGLMTVSAMQVPNGRLPAGCVASGGTAYSSTAMVLTSKLGLGLAELSDEVLVSVHCKMLVLVPSSEKTARELRKNSVPP